MIDPRKSIHAFRLREMFVAFKDEKLKMEKKIYRDTYKAGTRNVFSQILFRKFFSLVINDVIDSGVQFLFKNSGKEESSIYMDRVTGDELIKIRKKGGFKKFDLVKTDFNAYRIIYHSTKKNLNTFNRIIYVSEKYQKRICANAEKGNIKITKVLTYQDYYDRIVELYPGIPLSDIKKILRFGCTSIQSHMRWGADILIQYRDFIAYIGNTYTNEENMLKYILDKLYLKAAIMARRMYTQFTGYGYFCISKKKYKEIISSYDEGKEIDYGIVKIHKFYDFAFANGFSSFAMLKVPMEEESFPHRKMNCNIHLITDKAIMVRKFGAWNISTLNINPKWCSILTRKQVRLKSRRIDNHKKFEVKRITNARYN